MFKWLVVLSGKTQGRGLFFTSTVVETRYDGLNEADLDLIRQSAIADIQKISSEDPNFVIVNIIRLLKERDGRAKGG